MIWTRMLWMGMIRTGELLAGDGAAEAIKKRLVTPNETVSYWYEMTSVVHHLHGRDWIGLDWIGLDGMGWDWMGLDGIGLDGMG